MDKKLAAAFQNSDFTPTAEIHCAPSQYHPAKYTFFVDDAKKCFALVNHKVIKIYAYADLISFILNEDGETLTQGKGFATAVGGLTFGVLGAAVGAMGKRKNHAMCSTMSVQLFLNDLHTPQLSIPYITASVKKSSNTYKTALENANKLVGILTYIDNFNSNNSNNPQPQTVAAPSIQANSPYIQSETTSVVHADSNSYSQTYQPVAQPNISVEKKKLPKGCSIALLVALSLFVGFIILTITLTSKYGGSRTSTNVISSSAAIPTSASLFIEMRAR